MPTTINITGQRFDRLTDVERIGISASAITRRRKRKGETVEDAIRHYAATICIETER